MKETDARSARRRRVAGRLPNGLTLACLGLGFLASMAAGKGEIGPAFSLLALAAIADGLAGRVARGMDLGSEIGAELDSLASVLVWGVATALLMHHQALASLGPMGTVLAGLVAVSAAWRLCKGDVQSGARHYDGLPLPAAGVALVAAVAFELPLLALLPLAAALIAAMLMPLRYPPMNVKLLWAAPLFISLGAAAFGWREGWALPGLAGLAYALFARFLPTPERPAQ